MKRQIILASTSPRRKQLLELLKINFKAVDSGYEEIMHNHLPHHELVKFLALGKAKAAAKKYPKAIIIAADTIISFQGKALGKPKNKREAFLMLETLSGKSHAVLSGAAVLDAKNKKVVAGHHQTKIHFKKLSAKDINNYIASGQAMDKAGSYGPMGHGMNLIKKMEGDYTTDIGMNMEFIYNALLELGIKI